MALIETQSLAWLFDEWRLWLAGEVEEMAEGSMAMVRKKKDRLALIKERALIPYEIYIEVVKYCYRMLQYIHVTTSVVQGKR